MSERENGFPLYKGKKEWGKGEVVVFSSDHGFLVESGCPKIFPELHRLAIWDRAQVVSGLSKRTFALANTSFAFGAYKVAVDIKSSLDTGLTFKYMFPTGVKDLFHWIETLAETNDLVNMQSFRLLSQDGLNFSSRD